jgi:outer membrane protein assembly factor BamB
LKTGLKNVASSMQHLFSVLCAALVAAPAEADWPAFRGDGTSIAQAAELPLEWSDERGIAWQLKLDGYGQSSPVVLGDRVYVTSAKGEQKELGIVTAVDLNNGRRLWQQEITATQKGPANDYTSRAAPTPVVDSSGVYAFFESGDLAAYDHGGKPLWVRKLAEEYGELKGNHGIGGSLAQAGDLLFVAVDHDGPSYLLAIDKKSGKNRWKVDRPAKVSWSSPVVTRDADPQIVWSSAGTVESFRAADGKRLWSLDGLDGNTVPSATVTDKLVIVGSADAGQNLAVQRPELTNRTPGKTDPVVLTDDAVVWRLKEASVSFSSPLAYQGLVYLVNRAGAAFCVDGTTGTTLWTERLSGSCWASPIGAAGRVYFFGKDGVTTVAAAGPKFEKLAENRLTVDDRVYGVAAVPGAFVLRSGEKLICVGSPLAAARGK